MKRYLFAFTFLLIGCVNNSPTELVEPIVIPDSFVNEGSEKLIVNWWTQFNNKELTRLVNVAFNQNLELKARLFRLKANAIDVEMSGLSQYPNVSLSSNASSNIEKLKSIDTASLGVNASWELDVWGRLSANKKKSYWTYKGQQALYRANANLVAGNIANAWISLVSEQEKKSTLALQHKRTQNALTVISKRFAMGKNSVTTIWQQQRLLKSIEVQQSTNLTSIYNHKQTLALWLGIPLTELKYNHLATSIMFPPLPEIGIPAQLLKHRPDIENALTKIKSSNENLAIAIAARYPRITLRANYATSKSALEELLDDWSGNLISSLILPLFDSGATELLIKKRKLELTALMLEYQQVWLEAINSVNKVLVNETKLLNVLNNLSLQIDLAERTEKLTTIKYLNGKTSYINLLRAQESILALERQLIDANKSLMTNRVLLYRELSHGNFSLKNNILKEGVS